MSQADRDRWDRRYQEGAYGSREHPSALLERCDRYLPASGRALDLACGAGRNALYLAAKGLAVDAVDISTVALERAEAAARARADAGHLSIRWIEHDLDLGFDPATDYDVIVNIRYVNVPLLAALLICLRPGGLLLVEQHLHGYRDVVGPANPAFRVASGDLAELAEALDVEELHEGLVEDPDGRSAALARLLARKPLKPLHSEC